MTAAPSPRAPRTAEELYASLAFAPGEGPFKIKGTGYVFHDQWVRENLPGGVEAQQRALGKLGDHPFFRRDFVSAVMYDLFPLVALGHACAAVRGETFEQFVELRARSQAELDLRHIRKFVVKLASPTMVAARFPSILIGYFDFGKPHVEVVERGVRGRVEGIPDVLVSWLVATCKGFAMYALEVNGAKNVRFESSTKPRMMRERGFPMVDLTFHFAWD